jgi:hypothetical protein
MRANEPYFGLHPLCRKDILKFIYYLMILFLQYIFLNIFTVSTMWSEGSVKCCHFKFDCLLLELESSCEFI